VVCDFAGASSSQRLIRAPSAARRAKVGVCQTPLAPSGSVHQPESLCVFSKVRCSARVQAHFNLFDFYGAGFPPPVAYDPMFAENRFCFYCCRARVASACALPARSNTVIRERRRPCAKASGLVSDKQKRSRKTDEKENIALSRPFPLALSVCHAVIDIDKVIPLPICVPVFLG